MKKLIMIIFAMSLLNSCANVTDKVGKLKPNTGECPPQAERTLSDIICKEAK